MWINVAKCDTGLSIHVANNKTLTYPSLENLRYCLLIPDSPEVLKTPWTRAWGVEGKRKWIKVENLTWAYYNTTQHLNHLLKTYTRPHLSPYVFWASLRRPHTRSRSHTRSQGQNTRTASRSGIASFSKASRGALEAWGTRDVFALRDFYDETSFHRYFSLFSVLLITKDNPKALYVARSLHRCWLLR